MVKSQSEANLSFFTLIFVFNQILVCPQLHEGPIVKYPMSVKLLLTWTMVVSELLHCGITFLMQMIQIVFPPLKIEPPNNEF